jgi:hypothetical protein
MRREPLAERAFAGCCGAVDSDDHAGPCAGFLSFSLNKNILSPKTKFIIRLIMTRRNKFYAASQQKAVAGAFHNLK